MSIGNSIGRSIGSSIGRSIGEDTDPIFSLRLQDSVIPERAYGSPASTFTRATIDKFWGFPAAAITGASPILLPVASGEAGFLGSRRISEGVWSRFLDDGAPIVTANTANASLYVDAKGPFGYRSQLSETNSALHNRDCTDAVWVKTTMTPALDETGIDDVANSASSLLATGANATCLQGFTIVSTEQVTSFWLKRLVGSGTVNITLDNGVTWTAVTLTSRFKRFFVTATLANPTIGIRIVTSGDKIAFDYSQLEAGSFPTSEIEVAASPVVRNAAVLTYDDDGNILDATGTAICESSTDWSTAPSNTLLARDGSGLMLFNNAGDNDDVIRSFDGSSASLSPAGISTLNSPQKIAVTWGDSLTTYSPGNLSPDATPASYDGTMGSGNIAIACINNGSSQRGGTIRNVNILGIESNARQVA